MNNRYKLSLFFCFKVCASEIENISNVDKIDNQSIQESITATVVTGTTDFIETRLLVGKKEENTVNQLLENSKAKIQTGINQLQSKIELNDQTGINQSKGNSGSNSNTGINQANDNSVSSGNTGINQAKENTEHKNQTGLDQLARLKNNRIQNSIGSLSLEATNMVIYYTFNSLIAKYTFMKDGEYKKDEKNKIINGYKW